MNESTPIILNPLSTMAILENPGLATKGYVAVLCQTTKGVYIRR